MRFVFIPVFLLFISCSAQTKKNVQNYYFPPELFLTEMTYCFVNKNDTSEKTYWQMKATIENGDTSFHTTIYNNGTLAEKMTERISQGNSYIANYAVYQNDKESVCEVIDSLVYKQDQTDAIQWQVSFQHFTAPARISMTKQRTLQSTDNKFQTFLDTMTMKMSGTTDQYRYTLLSVYERGKGLVSYKLTRSDYTSKEFVLTEIR